MLFEQTKSSEAKKGEKETKKDIKTKKPDIGAKRIANGSKENMKQSNLNVKPKGTQFMFHFILQKYLFICYTVNQPIARVINHQPKLVNDSGDNDMNTNANAEMCAFF